MIKNEAFQAAMTKALAAEVLKQNKQDTVGRMLLAASRNSVKPSHIYRLLAVPKNKGSNPPTSK